MKKRIAVLVFLTVFLFAGGFFWWQNALLPPVFSDASQKIFVIGKGEGVREIARKLKNEGLIRSQIAFFLLVKKLGIEKDLQFGDFRLSPSMDAESLVLNLTHGTLDVWITIIEGWRKEEVAEYLQKTMPTPDLYLKAAENREGYLFPDTYLVPKNASASAVIKILTDNFAGKFNEKMKEDARKNVLSQNEAVILASLVEREAKQEEDRPIIAGILLRRLKADMPLQADATVQYILGYQPQEKSWWKKKLTKEDLETDSPYNTYKNTGLPKGPIANPGLSSLKAAVYPADTPYWYYLSDKTGKTHYAKNLEEHNENIRKYLE